MSTADEKSVAASAERPRLPPVICWQLDDGTLSPSSVLRGAPLVIPGGRLVAAAAAAADGGPRQVVLAEDGTALEASGDGHAFQAVPAAVHERLTQVSCGESDAVALTRDGQLVTWGAGDPPRPVAFVMDPPQKVRLEQVSCGDRHTVALSYAGEVFAWGTNDRGQLGLGSGAAAFERDPRVVRGLCGIPVRGLAAGAAHSVAVTLTGGVFAWGANAHGQLGIDRPQDARTPERVDCLRGWRVAHASCGARHTALLAEDGTLLVTNGVAAPAAASAASAAPGRWGRVVAPRGIGKISQVACSRSHTAALTADSGKIYLLLATNAAGGMVELALDGVPAGDPPGAGPFVVKKIFAGGNRIYATCLGAEESPVDANGTRAPGICTVTPELIKKVASKSDLFQKQKRQLEVILSSAACLNGSFLLSQRPSLPEHSLGLDVGEAKLLLGNLPNKVKPLLRTHLVPSLEWMCADEDSLRVPALLLLMPDPAGLTAPAVACVARLPDRLRRLFEQWLAHLPKADFLNVVKACTDVLNEHLTIVLAKTRGGDGDGDMRKMPPGLASILKKLHEIGTASPDTAEEDFHDTWLSQRIPELPPTPRDESSLRNTFRLFKQHWGVLEILTTFPFLLESAGKISLFESRAVHLIQFSSIWYMSQLMEFPASPHFVWPITIRRSNLIEDAIAVLRIPAGNTMRLQVQVSFVGEAVAGFGVNSEFFKVFMQELLQNEAIGIRQDRKSNLVWFSEDDVPEVLIGQTRFPCSDVYWVIGLVCGLAIYNRILTDFHFPLALYKKLLGVAPDLSDLRELSPGVARSMDRILADTDENLEDTLGQNFTCSHEANGATFQRELIPGGSGVMVTQQNKRQYVESLVRHKFASEAVQRKFEKFQAGFDYVCRDLCCRLLSPQELRHVACGEKIYDWPALQESIIYKNGFKSGHETIRMFWEVFHELIDEDKKRFLMFVTGSDLVPLAGMKALGIKFFNSGSVDDLPRSLTCFREFHLPPYGEKTLLREKIKVALSNDHGFAPQDLNLARR